MGEPSRAVLETRGLYHIYREGNVRTAALRGAELVIAQASWTTVMGPSGSGKSTLLHILAGLLEPSAGLVTVDGEDGTRLPPAARAAWRRPSVGLVLQRANLHPHLDVDTSYRFLRIGMAVFLNFAMEVRRCPLAS